MTPEAQELYDKIRRVYLQPLRNQKSEVIRARMWLQVINEAFRWAQEDGQDVATVRDALTALAKDLQLIVVEWGES